MSAAERVSSAMSLRSFAMRAPGYRRLFSWSRRVRTVPSMTVSPTVATRPPSTDGSTITLRSTFLPVALARAALQAVLLVGGQRDGRAHLGDRERPWTRRPAATRRSTIAGRSRPRPDPTTIEISCTVVGVALPPSRSSTIAWRLAARDQLVGERVAQLVVRLVRAGEAEQLVLDLVERALGAGDLEQRRGVAVDARIVGRSSLRSAASLGVMALRPTLAMKSSIRRCCVSSSSESVDDPLGGEPTDSWRSRRAARRPPGCRAAMSASALASSSATSRRAAPGRRRAAPRPARRPRRAAGPLGLDVAQRLADPRRLGVGAASSSCAASSSSAWIRAVRSLKAFLMSGPAFQNTGRRS